MALGRTGEAEASYERALGIRREALVGEDVDVAEVLTRIAYYPINRITDFLTWSIGDASVMRAPLMAAARAGR